MFSIIVAAVIFGGFTLAGAKVLLHRVRRYLRWRRETSMAPWKRGVLILFPLVLALAVFGRPLLAAPSEYPAQRSQLREITAPVEMAWEYQSQRATGRSIQAVKEYRIYLEDHDG